MEALEAILRKVSKRLFSYIEKIVLERDLAMDIHQDVLVQIATKVKWLQNPECFSGWCYRIAGRESIKHSNKERKRRSVFSDEVDSGEIADEVPQDMLTETDKALLMKQVNELPIKTRQVILLHYFHGCTLAESAAILDIPMGTAKSRLNYGLKFLRSLQITQQMAY